MTETLNDSPRSPNGTEDAHDYLWLVQDAWMVPAVWAWADSNAEAKAAIMKDCSRAGCGKREERVAQFKRCAACHQVWYCGTACQKTDWQMHKPGELRSRLVISVACPLVVVSQLSLWVGGLVYRVSRDVVPNSWG